MKIHLSTSLIAPLDIFLCQYICAIQQRSDYLYFLINNKKYGKQIRLANEKLQSLNYLSIMQPKQSIKFGLKKSFYEKHTVEKINLAKRKCFLFRRMSNKSQMKNVR